MDSTNKNVDEMLKDSKTLEDVVTILNTCLAHGLWVAVDNQNKCLIGCGKTQSDVLKAAFAYLQRMKLTPNVVIWHFTGTKQLEAEI